MQKDFEGRPQARIWMLDRAFGQRNLGDFQRVENRLAKKADLALIGEAKYKETVGRPRKEIVINIDNDLPKHNTRTELAKTAGVSAGNVYKVEKILEQASPELLTAVRAGDVTINLASQLATLPKEKQLEANLVADGCRDPLVVWGDVLIDGHNRFEICTRLGIPFNTVQVEFEDRSYATEWIIKNQFGRRNLTDFQRGELALQMKPIIEARALANRLANSGDKKSESAREISNAPIEKMRTDETLGKMAGLSSNTIRKIETLSSGITTSPELLTAVRAGEVTINLASQLATLPKEKQAEGDGLCWRVIGHCWHDSAKGKATIAWKKKVLPGVFWHG